MEKLKLFSVFLKLTVKGESEMDAIESVYTAVDTCDLIGLCAGSGWLQF